MDTSRGKRKEGNKRKKVKGPLAAALGYLAVQPSTRLLSGASRVFLAGVEDTNGLGGRGEGGGGRNRVKSEFKIYIGKSYIEFQRRERPGARIPTPARETSSFPHVRNPHRNKSLKAPSARQQRPYKCIPHEIKTSLYRDK